MQYTKTEKQLIADAYRKVSDFLSVRTWGGKCELDRLVREEIRQSKSVSLGQFSLAEARMHVLDNFRDGIACPDMRLSALVGIRRQLALATVIGAGIGYQYGEKEADALAEIIKAINLAYSGHEAARERFLARNRIEKED